MSLISTESSLESAFKQPSLVFPSLHNANKQPSKYSSKEPLQLNSNNREDLSTNSKNLQSCIHYASRLIKLRSELRSPSYMNRSNSTDESSGGNTIGRLFDKNNCTTLGNIGRKSSLYELSTTSSSCRSSVCHTQKNMSSPSLLSGVGRVLSLPNVMSPQNMFDYDKEDESEIFCRYNTSVSTSQLEKSEPEYDDDDDDDDGASQLTYLSDLVRASLRRRQTKFHESSNHLALPPRHHFSSNDSSRKVTRPRSISLRDMINEAIDEAIRPAIATNDNTSERPIILKNSQSFTLASQLLYASQNNCQQWQTEQKGGQQSQEEEDLLLADKKEVIDNGYNGVFDEKVEISSSSSSSSSSDSLFASQPIVTNTSVGPCCQCNKHATIADVTSVVPQPTKSRDDKSLFSVISSDSEEDDDDTKTIQTIHSFNKRIIQKRRLQKRPQAFLVSISPSSAAAASVARSRRSKAKQTVRAYSNS